MIVSIFFSCNPLVTIAQELPRGFVIGDDKGITATKNGKYFINVTDVMPGKTWITSISLLNMEKNASYKLSMLISDSKTTGKLDLSKEMQMKIIYDGKTVYEGPASGISSSSNLQLQALDLGIFNSGDSRGLKVEYSLSGKYTNQDFAKKNTMDNTWTFYAIKTKDTVPDKKIASSSKLLGIFPRTGEELKQGIIFLCLGLFLLLLFIMFIKKKMDCFNERKE